MMRFDFREPLLIWLSLIMYGRGVEMVLFSDDFGLIRLPCVGT